jgi:hypothetical protein
VTLAPVWAWVEATGVATAMRQSSWLYPTVEVVHLLGLGTLVGSAVLIDLRLLGRSATVPVSGILGHAVPVALSGAAVAVASGLTLFSAHAETLVENPVFRWKLLLLAAAGLNALGYHRLKPGPVGTKLHAAASLVLWAAVVTCGRFLAYV